MMNNNLPDQYDGFATPEELNALMAAGVVLFVMTLIVNMIATSIVQRSERRMAS